MLSIKDIAISFKIQQFSCDSININENGTLTSLDFRSEQETATVTCPDCGGPVHIYDNYEVTLKDMPFWIGMSQKTNVRIHRYRCQNCGSTFSEDICFKHKGTLITGRAASWIKGLLRFGLSITSVSAVTGIHWDTISRIHKEHMQERLDARKDELKALGYKPLFLAVDEFAIHKGHTYATCVIDLVLGDVIWVGKGRAKADFIKFFYETDMEYLSGVKAVAMDMNASYNSLVAEHMPYAEIVYDRYHMMAQYGRDVLGSVRLAEAKQHLICAKEIDAEIPNVDDHTRKAELKQQAKEERHKYTALKGSRWPLLMNSERLDPDKRQPLETILSEHESLAVCYAMKEEMNYLFSLRDPDLAKEGWNHWFEAAKQSGIPQLVKFAELKEKRLPGLISHATYPISTGKLEGLNNKIKVAKRIGYGYRNDEYFFTLIQYLSLPIKVLSPNFP